MLFTAPTHNLSDLVLPAAISSVIGHLPFAKVAGEFLASVGKNDLTIVTGAGGCGKSIGSILTLLLSGARVVCTEPRRLIASSLVDYASSLISEEPGTRIGVLTALEQRHSGWMTEATVCTDGYCLARQTHRNPLPCDVMIYDEVHEATKNLWYSLGIAVAELKKGHPVPKFVAMSASLDTEMLIRKYSGTMSIGHVHVEGSMFPVTHEWLESADYVEQVLRFTSAGKEVLFRLDGKQEIYSLKKRLEEKNADVEIIPLHRELGREEQQRCFQKYPRPKVILATTIARSGITPDVDVVITNGLERQSNMIEGIQRLELVHSSQFGLTQDFFRVGRLKEGTAVLISPVPFEQRPRADVPEMERTRYEQDILRLNAAGYSIPNLPMPTDYNKQLYERAKTTLRTFGCITDGNLYFKNTEKAEECTSLPAQFELGILVREAEKFGIKKLAMVCAAVIEAGGLALREKGESAQYARWKDYCGMENRMDPLAHLRLFMLAHELRAEAGDDDELFEEKLKEVGIDPIRYTWAMESLEMISKGEGKIEIPTEPPTGEVRGNLLICFIRAYREHAYMPTSDNCLYNPVEQFRELASSSIVETDGIKQPVILGIPFTVQGRRKEDHKLVQMAVVAPFQQVKAELPDVKLPTPGQVPDKKPPASSDIRRRRN